MDCETAGYNCSFWQAREDAKRLLYGFVKVAQDEGRHFTLLAAQLDEIGSSYGALPAHDGLWDSVITTSQDLLARLAIEHCVHEARGLNVLPTTIEIKETVDLLERVVYPEEITHCAAGVKWFKYLCERSKLPEITINNKESEDCTEEIIEKFHSVVREHFRGPLKPPFNAEARKAAGFGPNGMKYEPLAVQESNALQNPFSRILGLLLICKFSAL